MSLVLLIVVLVVIGIALYYLNQWPLDGTIKWLIRAVLIIAALFLILQAFGVLDAIRGVKVPRI